MKKLIQENTIGLVATVTPDGYPAVSPKATIVLLDDTHIAFIDLRSPKTRRNIEANPSAHIPQMQRQQPGNLGIVLDDKDMSGGW